MKKNLILFTLILFFKTALFAQIYSLHNTNTYLGTKGSLSNFRDPDGNFLPSWTGRHNLKIDEGQICKVGNNSSWDNAILIDTLFIDGTLRNTAYHGRIDCNVIVVSSTGYFKGKHHHAGRIKVTVKDIILKNNAKFDTPSVGSNGFSRLTWNGTFYIGQNVTLNTSGAPNNLISKAELDAFPGSYPKFGAGGIIENVPEDISTVILNSPTNLNADISGSEISIVTQGHDLVINQPVGDDLTIYADSSNNGSTPSMNLFFVGNASGSITFAENTQAIHSLTMDTQHPAGLTLKSALYIADSMYNPVALNLRNGIIFSSEMNPLSLNEYSFVANSVTTWNGHRSGGSDSSYVNGAIIKEIDYNSDLTSFFGILGADYYLMMPVGKNGQLREAGLGRPLPGLTSFRIEYFEKSHPYHNTIDEMSVVERVSNREYWNVDRIAGTAGASVILTYNENSGIQNDHITDAQVMHFDGTKWEDQGRINTSLDGEDKGTLASSIAMSFSPFTLGGSGDHDLPVELTHFMAEILDNGNLFLRWETATEINNSHFEIEGSSDNRNFMIIGQVEGNGNSNVNIEYDHEMEGNDIENFTYFRLKQVDFDGSYEFSTTIHLYRNHIATLHARMYPNPSHGSCHISCDDIHNDYLEIVQVYNNQGQEVFHIYQSNEHSTEMDLNTSNLDDGIYFVKIRTHEGQSLTEKLMVRK